MKWILGIGCLFLSSHAFGALAFDVNTSTGIALTASTHGVASPTFTSGANEIFIALIADACGGGKVSTLVTTGLNWQQVAFSSMTATGASSEIWRSSTTNAIVGQTALATMNNTGICGVEMSILSFTGADLTGTNGAGAIGAIGHQINASANSHAPTCNVTTTRDQSYVLGAMGDFDTEHAYTASAADTMILIHRNSSSDTELSIRTTNVVSGLTSTTLSFTDAATTDGTAFTCAEVLVAQGVGATPGFSKRHRIQELEE